MKSATIALALAAAACSREPPPPTPATSGAPSAVTPVNPIGNATMNPDGTIVMDLYTSGSTRGQARFVYPPNHPDYQKVLDHLGGLQPGENKAVPPWPDDIDDARVHQAVHAYVAEKKGWSRDLYEVEITGTDQDENIAVIVVHADDRKARSPGGGKSLALRIHPKDYVVVRELAMQ